MICLLFIHLKPVVVNHAVNYYSKINVLVFVAICKTMHVIVNCNDLFEQESYDVSHLTAKQNWGSISTR